MDDAKRFIRYVIPGIVFIVEISVYLYLSAKNPTIKIIQEIELLKPDKSSITLTLGALLASGALGYIFSNLYYALHTIPWGLVDHTELLKDAEEKNWIKFAGNKRTYRPIVTVLLEYSEKKKWNEAAKLLFHVKEKCKRLSNIKFKDNSQNDAWRIATALWKSRIESSLRIKGSDNRMDTLADIMHGLGTSALASFVAMIIWMQFHLSLTESLPWSKGALFVQTISILMVAVFYINYVNTKKNIQGIIRIILSEELQEHSQKCKDEAKKETNGPIIINY
jgi:hypothetical protein